MKTIKDAVIELGGKWPSKSSLCIYMHRFESEKVWECSSSSFGALYSKEQFESVAKRMANKPSWDDAPENANYLIQDTRGRWNWCVDVQLNSPSGTVMIGVNPAGVGHLFGDNKDTLESRPSKKSPLWQYRWGVEYAANGKKPELADDVEVVCFGYDGVNCGNGRVFERRWDLMEKFKITDPRYKPADTSYLNEQSKDRIAERSKMIANSRQCWPPVAGMTVELWHGGRYVEDVEFLCERGGNVVFWRFSNDSVDSAVMPTAELKPIRTEREKVIEAAFAQLSEFKDSNQVLGDLYDAGMLVLPPKKSDTED